MSLLNNYSKMTLKKAHPSPYGPKTLCGMWRPLRSFHFDNIDLLILWRMVRVHHRLCGHAAVLESPCWAAAWVIWSFTFWCSESLRMWLAVCGDIGLCVGWHECLTVLLWVRRCILLCLRGSVSKCEVISVATWWKPVHAWRAQSWQFKGLYVF